MNTDTSTKNNPSRKDVFRMFDRIAARYDFLNHFLSFYRDKVWRRRLAQQLPARDDLDVLDLATGTADQLLALFKTRKVKSGIGVDPAEKMLAIGRRKIEKKNLADKIKLLPGSAENLPFGNNTFDVVAISFGIRNVTNVTRALSEMHRVLRQGGRALILEFSLPRNRLIRKIYLLYFRKILPRLCGFIAGDRHAYHYLNETVEVFPYGEEFCALMRAAGFTGTRARPMTFGVATLYRGDKQ
ncbi:MAG: bifunctional demethylmenaquinone methyltransferase/2-methoxy-6-polyprenyl-1,4-benzoquinol methylase UbiE [candidate division Zixibacteria bacterium]|nr:bifunctional demethylmenaquinone methyltransferase/2-methoxy-6-polyprenyl-1,4-benzoquinol methylase UbiE [candidate division Zixibacteria bacterium]